MLLVRYDSLIAPVQQESVTKEVFTDALNQTNTDYILSPKFPVLQNSQASLDMLWSNQTLLKYTS